ncbi:aminotransferase class III-fold pyridoxal phosphate-dependent enzyme [Streptomyces minutiscleroticus]|uniref:aminotransferase class III-fold pyridoxal phosphate-dependent enzyme n=1 Tax=Streptomyces minutiscleroticus TaxID=68238 RepID=UPI003317900E
MAATEAVPGTGTRGERRVREGAPGPGPVARECTARTYARALPVVPVRARGMTIEGADGRRYLDCLSGAGTLALGHNHPVVLDALRGVLDAGAPLHGLGGPTPVEDAFVAELLRTLPAGLADRARVRFCGPGGAEAAGAAARLVRAATGRTEVLEVPGAPGAGPPDDGAAFPPGAAGSGAPPAGAVVEPVRLRDGDGASAADARLRRLRHATAARSVPLIADETRTGVGRTGAFWGVQHSGITPDVMMLSRAIGGSLPLAVLVHRDDLGPGRSDGRTDVSAGNQLAMAAGTATLAYVREHRLAERAAALGARMAARLGELAAEHACVGGVRGRGLMLGVAFVRPDGVAGPGEPGGVAEPGGPGGAVDPAGPGGAADRPAAGVRPPAPGLAGAVQRECLRRGLIVDLAGPRSGVVRLLPPLTISDEQADAVLERLADAVRAVAAGADTGTGPGRRHGPPGARTPSYRD